MSEQGAQRMVSRGLDALDHEELLATTRRLLAETEALSSRIAMVNEIAVAINRRLDLSKILAVVAQQSRWLLDFDYCGCCLHDDEGNWQITDLADFDHVCRSSDIVTSPNLGHVLKTGYTFLSGIGVASPILADYRSQMILPLTDDEVVVGALIFGAQRANVYTQQDVRIGFLLALQVAAAIRNATQLRELNRAQEILREYAAELEARNAELDAYSYTIAHDLKSPLATISLRVYAVEKRAPDLPPEAAHSLQQIRQTSLHMGRMIDQLLLLAKLRDPGGESTSVEIRPIIENALMRFEMAIHDRHIGIDIPPDLPSAVAPEQWLEEVFANLIGNAVKYIGDAHPTPIIAIRASQQGAFIRYEVRDNGPGIPPEKQANLFEMFTRAADRHTEGLGLGLSIVHRIISNLGGSVGVESTPGVGSTFWFTLPVG